MVWLNDDPIVWRHSQKEDFLSINFWLRMMSGHGANPVFFNKKIKIGHPEHELPLPHLRPITSHFALPPTHLTPQSGRHMCITP